MNEEEEKSFLFRERWYEQMRRLPDAERLQVYESVCAYAFEGETSDLVYYLESIMDNIRLTIDKDAKRQEAFIEKQRANGRKGGRPPKPKGLEENPTKPMGYLGNPTKPKKANNRNRNRNRNRNKDIIEKSEISSSTAASRVDPLQPVSSDEEISEKEEKGKSVAEAKESEAETFDKVKTAYNQAVAATSLPMIKAMTEGRRGAIRARLKEYGLQAVLEAIAKAAASNFLSGDNQRGFVASFDWIFRPNNFPKVLEGNYDNAPKPKIQNQDESKTPLPTPPNVHRGANPASRNDGGDGEYERRTREFEAHIRAKLAAADPETHELPF